MPRRVDRRSNDGALRVRTDPSTQTLVDMPSRLAYSGGTPSQTPLRTPLVVFWIPICLTSVSILCSGLLLPSLPRLPSQSSLLSLTEVGPAAAAALEARSQGQPQGEDAHGFSAVFEGVKQAAASGPTQTCAFVNPYLAQ